MQSVADEQTGEHGRELDEARIPERHLPPDAHEVKGLRTSDMGEDLAEGGPPPRQRDEVGELLDPVANETHARLVVESLDLGLVLQEELA